MAINGPSVDSQTITIIGITVFSDRKIIFSALKLFEKVLHIGQIIEAFQ